MANTKIMGISMLLAAGAVVLTGCQSYAPGDIDVFLKPYETDVTSDTYVMQPPDEVEVHCSQVPEIHLQRQLIRPDGKIAFESLGEILVAGKTIAEVNSLLTEKIRELYNLPNKNPLDARITLYRSKVYYMLGQFEEPGPKIYTGRDTLFMALSVARPSVLAEKADMKVIRPSADLAAKPKVFTFNYYDMMKQGDLSKDVLLEEGDIVYARPTWLAAVAMVVEEFVRPIARAFSTVYVVNRAGTGAGGI